MELEVGYTTLWRVHVSSATLTALLRTHLAADQNEAAQKNILYFDIAWIPMTLFFGTAPNWLYQILCRMSIAVFAVITFTSIPHFLSTLRLPIGVLCTGPSANTGRDVAGPTEFWALDPITSLLLTRLRVCGTVWTRVYSNDARKHTGGVNKRAERRLRSGRTPANRGFCVGGAQQYHWGV